MFVGGVATGQNLFSVETALRRTHSKSVDPKVIGMLESGWGGEGGKCGWYKIYCE